MINELNKRLKRVQNIMAKNDTDGLLILQGVNLFYFTNSFQVLAAYIPVEGDIAVFYKRSDILIKKDCPYPLIKIKSVKDIPNTLKEIGYNIPGKLGFEMDVLPVKIFNSTSKLFPESKAVDASKIIRETRMIKTEYEINIFKECGEIVNKVFTKAKDLIRDGKSEIDVSIEIEYAFRKNAHIGPCRFHSFNIESYNGHLLSGESALIPSPLEMTLGGEGPHPAYRAGGSHKIINKNEPIIMDYACNHKGYNIDTTRTYVIGKLPDELNKNYNKILEIYSTLLEIVKPGITSNQIYETVINMIDKMNLSENFMGYKESRVNFIGHGVGLEIDEYPPFAPRVNTVIEKNMVLAIEPKLFFPPYGAIGIEDTFLVTENGIESFAKLDTKIFEI